jgi:hypothetical protein
MSFRGIDDGVKMKVVNLCQIVDRLKSETSNFDGCALESAETSYAATHVPDDSRVNGNHRKNKGGTPVATYEIHEKVSHATNDVDGVLNDRSQPAILCRLSDLVRLCGGSLDPATAQG